MSLILDAVDAQNKKKEIPDFRSGDVISVNVKVQEGAKTRIQVFTGTVIQRRGSGMGASFTVRKMSGNIPVERIFPLHAPVVESIKVTRPGKVRRAKIFYLRERQGKAARIKERKV